MQPHLVVLQTDEHISGQSVVALWAATMCSNRKKKIIHLSAQKHQFLTFTIETEKPGTDNEEKCIYVSCMQIIMFPLSYIYLYLQ